MALPTISHNTPTAGAISWTAFNIQFNGAPYGIPADTSSKKFIWWVYNGGAPYLAAADEFPTLAPEDLLLFLNKNGIGLLVPMADVTDGSLVVPGSIFADAIGANQIDAYHLKANAITANAIAAGAVGAEEIAANSIYGNHISASSITVDKLTSGSIGDNAVANGSFEDATLAWEIISQTNGAVDVVSGAGISSSGTYSLRLMPSSTTSDLRVRQHSSKFIPVSSASGRRWYIMARMLASPALTKGVYLRANWFDASKVLVSSSDIIANAAMTTTFTVYEGQVTPPATARYLGVEVLLVNPNVTTSLFVDEITAREVIINAQIGDGQITAPKVAAKAITADKLVITDTTQLLPDPGLEFGGVSWSLPSTGTIVTIADPRVDGTKAMQIVANGAVQDATSDAFPVREGDWYYASCYYRQTVAGSTSGSVQLGATVNRTAAAGGTTWPSFSTKTAGTTALNTWTLMEGLVQIPAGATTFQLRPSVRDTVATGTYQFDDFRLRRMNGGELIVDGAITAAKIQTDAVTANKISANAVTTNAIAANAVTANQIAANAVTANQIAANAITANAVAANAIGANQIAANSIFGKHLIITDFTNLLTDPLLTRPIGEVWTRRSGVNTASTIVSTTGGDGNSIKLDGVSTEVSVRGEYFEVQPGQEYYFSANVQNQLLPAGTPSYVRIEWSKKDMTSAAADSSLSVNQGAWYLFEGTFVVPAGAYWARVFFIHGSSATGGSWWIANPEIRRRNGGELLVDGAIIARTIGANAVTANHLSANSVTANALGANSVTANALAANSVTANAIGANAVTANAIAANAVTANAIAAFSISATKLQIGDFENLATISETNGITVSSYGQTQIVGGYNTLVADSGSFFMFTDQRGPVPFKDGDRLYYKFTAKATAATTASFSVYIYNAANANKNTAVTVNIGTTDTVISGSILVPSTDVTFGPAKQFVLGLGSVANKGIQVKDVTVRRMTGGELLVDGSVTANTILANAVTTNAVAANAITGNQIAANAVTANKIAANSITANHIAANTITATQIATNTITANQLAANTISADKIAGSTITADKLLVSDRTNYWENPDFEGDTVGGIPKGTTSTSTANVRVLGSGAQGSTKAMELNALSGSNNDVFSTNVFPVEPGDQYYVSYDYKFLNTVGTAQAGVGFRTYGPTKAGITWTNVASTGTARPTTWQEGINGKEGYYTVPAGTYFLQPWVTFQNNGETTNRFHIDNIVIRRRNGGELLIDGSVTANTIGANAVTSNKISANAVTAIQIAANAVTANHIAANSITASKLESNLILATKIIAGDPNGTFAQMSNEGFRVYADADDPAAPSQEVVRLGVAGTNDYFAITKVDGSLAATIDQDGKISGSQVNANDTFYYKGNELTELLNKFPRGPLYKAELSTDVDNITSRYGLMEAEFTTDGSDRQIELAMGVKFFPTAQNSEVYFWVTYTTDGTAPTINSTEIFSAGMGNLSTTAFDFKYYQHTIRPTTMNVILATPGKRVRLLFGVTRGAGDTLRPRAGLNSFFYVNDIGPGIPHTPSFNPGGGSNPTPPPPVPARNTYTKQYGAVRWQSWDGNNNAYNNNTSVMYQGLSPAGWGNLKSMANMADWTGDISGSDINNIRVYFNFSHWYYNSGGTARIGVSDHTGLPYPFNWGTGGVVAVSGGWPKPGARWVDIPSDQWNNFKIGKWRSIVLEGDGSYGTYGIADPPVVEITYTK
jgi:hypothetical protein